MKSARALFAVMLGAAFLWTAGQLFFEEKIESLLRPAAQTPEETQQTGKTLRIATPFQYQSLQKIVADPNTVEWSILVNIFEPLVRQDENFRTQPALASSWAVKTVTEDNRLNELWEFRLRPGVTFHDGSALDAKDVVATFEYIKSAGGEIDNILASMESIEAVDDLTVRILIPGGNTSAGDALFLERLAFMLVFPSEAFQSQFEPRAGTGPFQIREWDENGKKIILEKFPAYWGVTNNVADVEISVLDGAYVQNAMQEKTVDMFMGYHFLPADKVDPPYIFSSMPGLTTKYIAFNFNSEIFQSYQKTNRTAFSLAIDQQAIIDLYEVDAAPATQFVPPGVFGFNPEIKSHEYNLERAKQLAQEGGLTKKTLKFVVFEGQEELGRYFKKQIESIGVNLELLPVSDDYKNAAMSDFFVVPFTNVLANSLYFLETSVQADGYWNTGYYDSSYADYLIKTSRTNYTNSRSYAEQMLLLKVMKYIVEDDVFGVPLYAENNTVVHRSTLSLPARLDGLIYFNDLTNI